MIYWMLLQHDIADRISRWDDDVVFRNQARGTENKGKKEFVNVRISLPSLLHLILISIALGSPSLRLS